MLGCAEQFMLLCLFFRTVRCASLVSQPLLTATTSSTSPPPNLHTLDRSPPPPSFSIVRCGLCGVWVGDVLRGLWIFRGAGVFLDPRHRLFHYTMCAAAAVVPLLYSIYRYCCSFICPPLPPIASLMWVTAPRLVAAVADHHHHTNHSTPIL